MKNNLIFLLFIVFCWSCKTTQTATLPDSRGTWNAVTAKDGSLPTQRHEAAFVGVKDKFYLLGGRRINPVSIFNTKVQVWTSGATPPLEIHHFQPVVYKNKIYLLGAMTGNYPGETPVPNVYIYDPKTDQWKKGAEIPENRRRGGAGAVLYKDKIYLVCGIKDGHRGDHKKWLDAYDPKTDTWEQLPDAPRPRDHFQAVVVNDKLYTMGGRTTVAADNPFKNTIAEIDVYDFNTQTWTTLENGLPTKRAGNHAVVYGKDILVIGGESFTQEVAHNEVEALNVLDYTWRTLSPMIEGRHGSGVILHKNKFYIASGSGNRGGGPELTNMECLGF